MIESVALLLFCLQPSPAEPRRDDVDVLELNHFYDTEARPIFDQVIFWEWDSVYGAHYVRAWRLWKSEGQTPRRDWERGGYVAAWNDGETFRVVRAISFRETWTQYDPELRDREYLPIYERSGLTGEKVPPPFQPFIETAPEVTP